MVLCLILVVMVSVAMTQAFHSISVLEGVRRDYPAFCIPMLHIAATISNNVPGTDLSLGCDTALNIIIEVSRVSCVAGQQQIILALHLACSC